MRMCQTTMSEYTMVGADIAMRGKVRTAIRAEGQQATGTVPIRRTKKHRLQQHIPGGLGRIVPFVDRVRTGT